MVVVLVGGQWRKLASSITLCEVEIILEMLLIESHQMIRFDMINQDLCRVI